VRLNFDPNDARSVVAKIAALLGGLQAQLDLRFDPKRKDSVLGNIDQRLDTLMKRLAAPDGPFQAIAAELQALKLQIVRQEAERTGGAQVMAKSTAKGDLRGTGLTWMAIRGDDPLKIQQRAGHTSFEMTQKYIRTAEAVGEAIGDVFPPLPASLTPANGLANRPSDPQAVDLAVEAPGIAPSPDVGRPDRSSRTGSDRIRGEV
jgi:hypothetical protein